jgi:fatty acid-binding protein DegV
MGERSGGNLGDQTILIHHGDDLEAAHKLREMIREAYGIQSFVIHTVGSVIGAHSGPGTLAVFYLKPKAESL